MRSRRRFLAVLAGTGSAAVAGCLDQLQDDEDETGTTGGNNPNPTSEPEPTRREVVDARRTISEDEYLSWSFELNRTATVSFDYTVRQGPDIDVFVADDREYAEFEAGNRFQVFARSTGVSGRDSATVSVGTYHLVIDNTNRGWASPPTNFNDDYAEVEITADIEG